MTQQRFLILLSFGTLLAGTESRTSLNGLRQPEDKKFDDLLQNVFPQNDNHQVKEEKNLEANVLSRLVELSSTPNKNNRQSLTNKSSDISTIFDDIIGKSAEDGNNFELFQKIKDNNDFRNLDKNIKKEVMQLSTLQNNEVLTDLFSLLAPYIERESEAGNQNLKLKVNKNRASENELRHTLQLDAKVLKSHAEVDKQTGTKFFDNRPNMTDLLNNIRNITKGKQHDQTTVSSLAAELLLDPLIALGEQDLYYGPTATYGFKETYLHSALKETRLAANQKASGLIAKQRSKDDSNLRAHDLQDKSSLTKTGRKINRSVKIQKRTYPMENLGNNFGNPSKVLQSSPKISVKNSEFLGQAERSKVKIPQNNSSRHETHGGSIEESSDVKKLDLKTEEITALTARIVADIVKEIDKRYRHECESDPTKSPNLSQQTEDQGIFLSTDPCTDSTNKIDQINLKVSGQTDKVRKEEYNTLKSLNFPVVTTKLITKPAGIPLYKIPNTEIYIYDLYPANKSSHIQMKITDQNDLASILDQLIANNSPGLDHHKNKLSESVLGIDPNESLLHQSIFDKNLLPDFFDSLIQSKSEAATEKVVTKSPDMLEAPITYTSDPSQVIPEIEIHIRTVPLGPKNASNVDLPHKKPILGKRDPFSDIFLFNGRNQKNSNPSPKTPYQRKIIGASQQPAKKKPVPKQQPKLDSDNPEAQKRIRSFWGLKSK